MLCFSVVIDTCRGKHAILTPQCLAKQKKRGIYDLIYVVTISFTLYFNSQARGYDRTIKSSWLYQLCRSHLHLTQLSLHCIFQYLSQIYRPNYWEKGKENWANYWERQGIRCPKRLWMPHHCPLTTNKWDLKLTLLILITPCHKQSTTWLRFIPFPSTAWPLLLQLLILEIYTFIPCSELLSLP